MTVPALSEWRTACSVERRGAFLTTGNARKKGEIRAMRKNKMMRAASGLLVAVLLSTCAISGTFAKYTTSVSSSDKARVAKWGFNESTINLTDLFSNAYVDETATYGATGNKVNAATERADLIAPGTTGSAKFSFVYGGDGAANAPEVAYKFTVDTNGSKCDPDIQSNTNIKWQLDNGTWGTWTDLIANIKKLSGDVSGEKEYKPQELPTDFGTTNPNHTITWKWIFDENANNTETDTVNKDATDTSMGNATELAEVELKITVTATQID